jgi:hypothetical protein
MNTTEIGILIVLGIVYISLVYLAWKVYRMPLGNDENIRKKQPKVNG